MQISIRLHFYGGLIRSPLFGIQGASLGNIIALQYQTAHLLEYGNYFKCPNFKTVMVEAEGHKMRVYAPPHLTVSLNRAIGRTLNA